ncbi:MAG: hypothetical protein LC663_00005 [Actinobacteria bacterium]|nr:hypothetical protein [Actinomycetota bacterium]
MKIKTGKLILLAATIVAAIGPVSPSHAAPGSTYLMSAGRSQSNGPTPATSVPDTTSPDLSLDGLTVAFSSDASNLVAGDTNGAADVFIRRVAGGQVVRVSTTSTGAQANGASYSPSLSVDGRYLAFVSAASNLVAHDSNGVADVFLKDLKTGAVQRISVATDGTEADGASNSPFVSLFGDYVTFESGATNLAPGDTNGLSDAFLRDVKRRTTTRIAPPPVAQDFTQAPEKVWSAHARISYDGRYLSFQRGATRGLANAAPPLPPNAAGLDDKIPSTLDVFITDRPRNRTTQIVVPPWAGSFKSMNEEPVISADGHYVAFTTWSAWTNDQTIARLTLEAGFGPSPVQNDDAVARNTLDPKAIMMYDRISKVLIPISTNFAGVLNGDSYAPTISADGAEVAFLSNATNAVSGDTNGTTDVFVRDLRDRGVYPRAKVPPTETWRYRTTLSRVSLSSGSAEANGASARPSISYNGESVSFASSATDLVGGDTNGASDVFLRARQTKTPNHGPRFSAMSSATRGVNIGDTVRIALRAADPDHDPLRYGAIIGLPTNASLDANTGVFSWNVGADPAYFEGSAAAYLPNGRTKDFFTSLANSELGLDSDPFHPGNGGRDVYIVFWVEDPRGLSDYALVHYFVRDVVNTGRCVVQQEGPTSTFDQINKTNKDAGQQIHDDTSGSVTPPYIPIGAGACVTPKK